MSTVPDDVEARPGSAVSLLRTLVGLYLRDLGGWIATDDLVDLMAVVGVEAPRTRTALHRVRRRGLLVARTRDRPGSVLAPEAEEMLVRGDRRIFADRRMTDGDPWCLVSFSLPEDSRDVRHRIRRRLQWIGCGTVSAGLWIAPGHLIDEVDQVFGDLGVRDAATLFLTDTPRVAGDLAGAVADWWDLEALRAEHTAFLQAVSEGGVVSEGEAVSDGTDAGRTLSGPDAFGAYVRLVDTWRVIPYVDPGLPPGVLPADWPGSRSIELFHELRAGLMGPARAHVCEVTGS
ncbi:PaaX family transcriptional regulator [Brevibacterium litoralis]|uniref:PaaX family transcriptional regulator n=1 Tax=Brevibacterium litoralis TaxID=3138935 RepID=UPI0032EE43BA